MINDFFRISVKNLTHRKLRSWLTIIGIIISIASIISLITVTQGLQTTIVEQFEKMGSNRIFVTSFTEGMPSGTDSGLTMDDVDVLEGMSEFNYVTPYLMKDSIPVEFQRETVYKMVMAWPTEDSEKRFADYDFEFSAGRMFRGGEKYSVILGYLAATDMFENEIRLKNRVLIKNQNFEVIGILEKIGTSDDDNAILIPLETARTLFEEPTAVSMIDATVKEGKDIELVAEKVQRKLEKSRNDENFRVMSPMDILQFLKNALMIVQVVLVSIAAISLIVGAVGIVNSMYTSVLERTKEIGIMKSIGARNNDILILFLIESGFIGLIGGVIGVILGMAIAYIISFAVTQAGFGLLQVHFSPLLVLIGLLFAFFIGMISGALPARQASKLKPIEALRY